MIAQNARLVRAMWIALAVALCCWIPGLLYFKSEQRFFFPFVQVLPLVAGPLALVAVIGMTCLHFGFVRSRPGGVALIAALGIYVWINGLVLVPDVLAGKENPEASWMWIVPVAIAMTISAAIMLGGRRLHVIVAAWVAVMVGHAGVLAADDGNPVRRVEEPAASQYRLGGKNLVVLLLDGLQSDVFAEVITARPDLREALDGFTYFPNTLGVGRTTYVALPSILSGRMPGPTESMSDYFDRAIGRESFLTQIAGSGWGVTVINPVGAVCPAGIDRCFTFDARRRPASRARLMRQSATLLDLSMAAVVPPPFDGAVSSGPRRVQNSFVPKSPQEMGDAALQEFARRLHVDPAATPQAKFLHASSTHAPALRRSDCSMLPKAAPISRRTAHGLATCASRASPP